MGDRKIVVTVPRADAQANGAPIVAGGGILVALIALLLPRKKEETPRQASPHARTDTMLAPDRPATGTPTAPAPASNVIVSGPRSQPNDATLPAGSASLPGAPSFGRFSVVRKLASGGMADLFLAQVRGEASFEKYVVIKRLHAHIAERPELREYFLDEARLAAKLSHPNIVQIYELGKDDAGAFFIAMEYIEGLDLAVLQERLDAAEKQMPLRAALTIGLAVCEGLHYAHTATGSNGVPLRVVHRDIKPSNVLLSREGAVKVTDFGIAKASQQVHVTEIGSVAGTISYMAPEQRTAQPLDHRADLFGVGAILYELVTGTTIDLDLVKLMQKGMAGWPHLPRPSQVRPELPPALDAIIFRALAYDAAARHPDCRALGKELEQVLLKTGEVPSSSYLAEWLRSLNLGTGATEPTNTANVFPA